ncbi:MAG: hypothetical protein WD010_02250 [Nitriliruptor sp.]|uniref:T3SS (YopN, CesT) and YbjN peptide-binding chaperone 1 n=1 Tax=Nitriliruptor sp. TaxID=2448056 RepID=UPI0034A00F69
MSESDAGHDTDQDGDGDGTATDQELGDLPGVAPGDPTEAAGAGDDASATTADSADEEDGDEPHVSSALAAVAQASTPPRPPRRTGVFLDPEDLRTHVGALLRAILGGYEVDTFGNYTFTHEGARIFVTVNGSPIGPQVGVFSVTNLELDLSPELATFLLVTNHTLGFGAFSYDTGNRAVWLRHTLLGTTLDGPELQSAVAAVATTAARLDHPIRDRFGGRTFADAPDDVQRGVEPPQVDPEPSAPNASGYL